jgi:hypothetical protein
MHFKWKNYFEITKQGAIIPEQTRDLKMSDHCTLRVKNLGGSRVEINCIGEGKEVHKRADTLTPPKWLVLGRQQHEQYRVVHRPAVRGRRQSDQQELSFVTAAARP